MSNFVAEWDINIFFFRVRPVFSPVTTTTTTTTVESIPTESADYYDIQTADFETASTLDQSEYEDHLTSSDQDQLEYEEALTSSNFDESEYYDAVQSELDQSATTPDNAVTSSTSSATSRSLTTLFASTRAAQSNFITR